MSDEQLILRERAKWEALTPGRGPADLTAWFAPDFINIGYFEDGPHRTGMTPEVMQKIQAMVSRRAPNGVPPDAITLDDFLVRRLSPDVAIVTYAIHDRLEILNDGIVTSIWQRRGDAWVTVFYQASAGR